MSDQDEIRTLYKECCLKDPNDFLQIRVWVLKQILEIIICKYGDRLEA